MSGPSRPHAPGLVTWLALFGAMTATVPVYAVVAFVFGRPGEPPESARPLRMAIWAVALLALFAAQRLIAPFRKALAGVPGLAVPDAKAFFGRSVAALALAEAAAVLGLVLVFVGGGRTDFLFLGTLALVVDFAIILPAGLAFFRQPFAPGRGPIEP
jgi:hypothetical protein